MSLRDPHAVDGGVACHDVERRDRAVVSEEPAAGADDHLRIGPVRVERLQAEFGSPERHRLLRLGQPAQPAQLLTHQFVQRFDVGRVESPVRNDRHVECARLLGDDILGDRIRCRLQEHPRAGGHERRHRERRNQRCRQPR